MPFAVGPATAAERRASGPRPPAAAAPRASLARTTSAARSLVALCQRRIEGHQFAVELEGVAVERGEQRRIGQIEIGLVERDLRGVDRLVR